MCVPLRDFEQRLHNTDDFGNFVQFEKATETAFDFRLYPCDVIRFFYIGNDVMDIFMLRHSFGDATPDTRAASD